MRTLILLLGLCVASASAADGPRLRIARKEVDFGELVQGQTRDLTIRVENAGDEPLLLHKAEPTCGCTLTRLPTDPIAPGGAAELGLRFESRGRLGRQHVQVLIYSNDPTQNDQGRSCTLVTLTGDVRSHYRVAPAGAFFGELVRGADPGVREVSIMGMGPAREGFTLTLGGELPEWVQAEVVPAGSPEKMTLKVRLLPDAPVGEVHTVLELRTSVKEQPLIEVPVVAIVTAGVVAPDYVQLLRSPRGAKVERRVPLERRDGKQGIPVRGLEFDRRWLEVAQEPLGPQRLDLLLSLRPDAPPGAFATELVVLLDDPELPRITIPVFGAVEPRVQVDPPELLFPAAGEGELVRRVVVRGGRVAEAALQPEGSPLQVKVLPPERGRQVIELRLPAGAAPPAGGRLVLRTDVAGEERVGVPIVVRDGSPREKE